MRPIPNPDDPGMLHLTGRDTGRIGDVFSPTRYTRDLGGSCAMFINLTGPGTQTLAVGAGGVIHFIAVIEGGIAFGYEAAESRVHPVISRAQAILEFEQVILQPVSRETGNQATGMLELNGRLTYTPQTTTISPL